MDQAALLLLLSQGINSQGGLGCTVTVLVSLGVNSLGRLTFSVNVPGCKFILPLENTVGEGAVYLRQQRRTTGGGHKHCQEC